MDKIQVAIMMGSKNDMPIVEETANMLKAFGIGFEMKVTRPPGSVGPGADMPITNGIGVFPRCDCARLPSG